MKCAHTSAHSLKCWLHYMVSDLTCSTTKENALVKDEQRTFDEEMGYIKQISPCCYTIKKGCVPNMKVMTQ